MPIGRWIGHEIVTVPWPDRLIRPRAWSHTRDTPVDKTLVGTDCGVVEERVSK
ncbi:MAG: hypothetical protein K2Y35_17460 [Burkholderiales bacterium]|nr:hypothetical protein [Burkholderiales bacterium]